MNVRFEWNNGHGADVMRCLLLTHSGHQVFCFDKRESAVGHRPKCGNWHPAERNDTGVADLSQPRFLATANRLLGAKGESSGDLASQM
jgi:hypothetical protein